MDFIQAETQGHGIEELKSLKQIRVSEDALWIMIILIQFFYGYWHIVTGLMGMHVVYVEATKIRKKERKKETEGMILSFQILWTLFHNACCD